MSLKILGVSGSLRSDSFSRRSLDLVLDLAREHGAETRVLDFSLVALPMYRPDAPASNVVRSVADLVSWADAFLLATPDYHGSMSGAIKNFLDFHWEGFAGKVFGVLCTSHEVGLTAMDQLRTAIRQCYGWTLPYGVSVNGEDDFDDRGALCNPRLEARFRMTARDLVVYGGMIGAQFRSDLSGGEPESFAARFVHSPVPVDRGFLCQRPSFALQMPRSS
jgi:NAD(P)H-dependent FMN reductase